MSGSANPLVPTYTGLVTTTLDALILFEACLGGILNHVPRRPHDKERSDLIRSGNVFIYEESASGIKRWTDGITWSPSRILGNFLVYRELDQAFAPGEKKRALKKPASKRLSTGGITKPASTNSTAPSSSRLSISGNLPASLSTSSSFDDAQPSMTNGSSVSNGSNGGNGSMGANSDANRDPLRELVGSLTDSYDFKENGLVKKTISIKFQGISHHLVSYYSLEDATSDKLMCPSNDPNVRNVRIREELLFSQTFRAAISEGDYQTAEGRVFTNGYMAIPHQIDNSGVLGHVPAFTSPFETFTHSPSTHMSGFPMHFHQNSYDSQGGFDPHGQPGAYTAQGHAAYESQHQTAPDYTYHAQSESDYTTGGPPIQSFSNQGPPSVPDYGHHGLPALDYAPHTTHPSHPVSSADFMPTSMWAS
jgi:hypothetical protein